MGAPAAEAQTHLHAARALFSVLVQAAQQSLSPRLDGAGVPRGRPPASARVQPPLEAHYEPAALTGAFGRAHSAGVPNHGCIEHGLGP